MITRNLRWCCAVAVALTACKPGADYFLTDTEGWSYRVRCTESSCATEAESPHAIEPARACTNGTHPAFVLAGHGVVSACHACARDGVEPEVNLPRCRAIRCSHDDECPPHHEGSDVRCVHGFCETPARPEVDLTAMTAVCMAGAGPSSAIGADALDRLAFARRACAQGPTCAAAGSGCRTP